MGKSKFTARDAINIGIYAVLYAVVAGIAGSIGYIPILYPFAVCAIALLGGTVYLLFISKVKHFGMISILGALLSGFLTLTGHGIYVLVLGIIISLFADFIASGGAYRSFKKIRLSHAVFSLIMPTTYLPMLLAADSFYEYTAKYMSPEWASQLKSVMQGWVFPLVFIGAFIFGYLGAMLGRVIMKKHLQRAGVSG